MQLAVVNGKPMFEHLASLVEDYNNSKDGKAAFQEYDTHNRKAFILCIVTGLICKVHEKALQARKLYYIDTSSSFEPLNTSITLYYTSCAAAFIYLILH
ncbi:hypothetical protein GLOIN_2v1471620 [Rhizophagus clarus]|uniref:Uncharacterized protein n=1 Tax=Rhizophagus clarus TaxID=94130 RepID=A0A8H3LMF6_9GLOM|nr:hypothetical protein GLOIN_2v1471620 [Rhizophagus clarus]